MNEEADVVTSAPKVVDHTDELNMLRNVLYTLLDRINYSRGKKTVIQLDMLLTSVTPELVTAGGAAKLNAWFAERTQALAAEAAEAEARRKAIVAAAIAKLSAEERSALGIK